MSTTTTPAPARANSTAQARPIPDAPPVTIATWPAKLIVTRGASAAFWQRRAEPAFVNVRLFGRRIFQGHDAIALFDARAELGAEGAQVVGAKDGQLNLVAGLLLIDARIEEVERGGARTVNGDDLIVGIDALLVSGRVRWHVDDEKM